MTPRAKTLLVAAFLAASSQIMTPANARTIFTLQPNQVPAGPLVADGPNAMYAFVKDCTPCNTITALHIVHPVGNDGPWTLDKTVSFSLIPPGEALPNSDSDITQAIMVGKDKLAVVQSELRNSYVDSLYDRVGVLVPDAQNNAATLVAKFLQSCDENDCYDNMRGPSVDRMFLAGKNQFETVRRKDRPSGPHVTDYFSLSNGTWTDAVMNNGFKRNEYFAAGPDGLQYSWRYVPDIYDPQSIDFATQTYKGGHLSGRHVYATLPYGDSEYIVSAQFIDGQTVAYAATSSGKKQTFTAITPTNNEVLFTQTASAYGHKNYYFNYPRMNKDGAFIDTSNKVQFTAVETSGGWQFAQTPSFIDSDWAMVRYHHVIGFAKKDGTISIDAIPLKPKNNSASNQALAPVLGSGK